MRISTLQPRHVEYIPDELEDGVLYISERFRTCSHRCCCGCGEEVVTPLSPAEWTLTTDGSTASLWPSIGNWDYACQSHYVIRRNQVIWAKSMTAKQIAGVQRRDSIDLKRMVEWENCQKDRRLNVPARVEQSPPAEPQVTADHRPPSGLWALLRRLLGM